MKLRGVGKIFDILRLEEIISVVAHDVGDAVTHHVERVGAVAVSGREIVLPLSHRVDVVLEPGCWVEELDVAEGVRLCEVHAIENFGLSAVFAVEKFIGSRRAEVAIVVEHVAHHFKAQVGLDVAD